MKPLLLLITLSAVVSACVTINIYFPAAAAEKAADKVIEEVWQLNQNKESGAEKAPNADKASNSQEKPAQ